MEEAIKMLVNRCSASFVGDTFDEWTQAPGYASLPDAMKELHEADEIKAAAFIVVVFFRDVLKEVPYEDDVENLTAKMVVALGIESGAHSLERSVLRGTPIAEVLAKAREMAAEYGAE